MSSVYTLKLWLMITACFYYLSSLLLRILSTLIGQQWSSEWLVLIVDVVVGDNGIVAMSAFTAHELAGVTTGMLITIRMSLDVINYQLIISYRSSSSWQLVT